MNTDLEEQLKQATKEQREVVRRAVRVIVAIYHDAGEEPAIDAFIKLTKRGGEP